MGAFCFGKSMMSELVIECKGPKRSSSQDQKDKNKSNAQTEDRIRVQAKKPVRLVQPEAILPLLIPTSAGFVLWKFLDVLTATITEATMSCLQCVSVEVGS